MLQKRSILKTLDVFFTYPTKSHYLMDIARTTGIAHTSIKKNLKELVKEGIINEKNEKRGKRQFPIYNASLNTPFKKLKMIHNLEEVQEAAGFIEDKLAPRAIVLFGSYSRGEDVEDSDIDIFVECKKEELNLSLYEKNLKRKIELHFNDNFQNYPKELKNNIINGIVLRGYLEAYK